MKQFLILITVTCVLTGHLASANAQKQIKEYHLDKYPEIGELFDWGMSVDTLESVLHQKLSNVGQDKYQAKFPAGELSFDATFIISDEGLEGLVLQFDISPDDFFNLLDTLRAIYGEPTAVDTNKGAMQWKDTLNDTGIIISGKKNGLYSIVVGLRRLRNTVSLNHLDPGKISSLEGIALGMYKDVFLKQATFFEPKKLPPEDGMPADAEVYQAFLTINLTPAEAFFEFNQDKLVYVMIYIAMESNDGGYMAEAFKNNLNFLSVFYGDPLEKSADISVWYDDTIEMKFGIHPFGTFVVSWELLSKNNNIPSNELVIKKIPAFRGLSLGMPEEEFHSRFDIAPLEKVEDSSGEIYWAHVIFNSRPSIVYFSMHKDQLAVILLEMFASEGDDDQIDKDFQNHVNYLTSLFGESSKTADHLAIWENGLFEIVFAWASDVQRFRLAVRDRGLLAE